MAYAFRFDKAAAREILEAIQGNKPIVPTDKGWTVERMIAVAGAMFCVASTHGPLKSDTKQWIATREGLPVEYQEARDAELLEELSGAVTGCATIMARVQNRTDADLPSTFAIITDVRKKYVRLLPLK